LYVKVVEGRDRGCEDVNVMNGEGVGNGCMMSVGDDLCMEGKVRVVVV
jgi:hypothetical protein